MGTDLDKRGDPFLQELEHSVGEPYRLANIPSPVGGTQLFSVDGVAGHGRHQSQILWLRPDTAQSRLEL